MSMKKSAQVSKGKDFPAENSGGRQEGKPEAVTATGGNEGHSGLQSLVRWQYFRQRETRLHRM